MAKIIDARGLSCPQPVLMTLSEIRELSSGEIEVIVDDEVSKENVSRAARNAGWQLMREEGQNGDFRLLFTR